MENDNIAKVKMKQLIQKYKDSNYLNCSENDVAFMTAYIDEKLKRKDYAILEEMTQCDAPLNDNFNLHEHYSSLYKNAGIINYPSYSDKNLQYSCNIKNFYDKNQYLDDATGVARLQTIFDAIADPQKGYPNKALYDLSQNVDIVFQISAGKNFDGECRYHYSEKQKPVVNIVVTDKALAAPDDALAVLIGHELSHAIDINKLPLAYKGNIGWEAPEDFANITGAQIALNSGYDPEKFILAQGTMNPKTQRAADVIRKYVPKKENNRQKIEKLRNLILPKSTDPDVNKENSNNLFLQIKRRNDRTL